MDFPAVRTELLISIRNASEAVLIDPQFTGIVDVKNPDRGPLGPPVAATLKQILDILPARQTISLAFGELDELDFSDPDQASQHTESGIHLVADHDLLQRVNYVKLGLSNMVGRQDWQQQWRRWVSLLSGSTIPVGVYYADRQSAHCPPVNELLDLLSEYQSAPLLIDTFDKSRGSLCDHIDLMQLKMVIERARRHGIKVALAGSIREHDLSRLLQVRPDWIGVRGAVCRNGRQQLDPQSLKQFLQSFDQVSEAYRT